VTALSLLQLAAPLLIKAAETYGPMVIDWFHPDTSPEARAKIEGDLADARAALDAALAKVPADLAKTDAEVQSELAPDAGE
jgi:hypothetical protein